MFLNSRWDRESTTVRMFVSNVDFRLWQLEWTSGGLFAHLLQSTSTACFVISLCSIIVRGAEATRDDMRRQRSVEMFWQRSDAQHLSQNGNGNRTAQRYGRSIPFYFYNKAILLACSVCLIHHPAKHHNAPCRFTPPVSPTPCSEKETYRLGIYSCVV